MSNIDENINYLENMSKTHDELIDKAFELRKKDSFEESLLAARSALAMDSESADAWWLIALNNESLENDDSALEAFEKSLELYEENSYRWARFGKALKRNGQDDVAIDAFETALKADPTQEDALIGLTTYYCWDGEHKNEELGFKYLKALDENHELTSDTYINKLGGYYYAKNLYLDALRCFKRCISYKDFQYGLYNAGLAYSVLGQSLNALDTWFEGIKYYPEYEVQKIEFDKALRAFKQTASKVNGKKEILEESEWYDEYLNPFELLDISSEEDLDEIAPKTIQNYRKLLLQEIDLEDGQISWLNHKVIDKSRAIGLVDSLNDENQKNYHLIIYQKKFILNFLTKGDISLFLIEPCDEIEEFIDALKYDDDFEEWFSSIFAKQFDIVFKRVLKSNNPDLFRLMISGRHWVNDAHLSDLFSGSYDEISKLLDCLREADKTAEKVKPTYQGVSDMLAVSGLQRILLPLPPQFIDLQEEAAKLVRSIAIHAMNKHKDSAVSKDILDLAKTLIPKGSKMTFDLKEDTETINEIIANEKKDESALTIGKVNTSIKKEGVRHDTQFIPAEKVEALCWGASATRGQYSTTYLYSFRFIGSGQTINVSWSGSKEGDKSKELFDQHVNALFSFILPHTESFVKNQLDRGGAIMVGGCRLTKANVQFETKGWFSSKSHSVPWSKLKADFSNGELTICSIDNYSEKVSMPLMTTPNSFILYLLVKNYEA
jgi:tetratricopeptide (TPR) repeat protein